MPQVNIMTWNLGDITIDRYGTAGFPFIEFLGTVMLSGNVSLLSMSGIRDNQARAFGEALVAVLNNRTRTQNVNWNYLASPPLGAGWDEQYLIVWNLTTLQAVAPDGTNYWFYDFPRPSGQQGYYGFPQLRTASTNMPPFLMFFRLLPSTKVMCASIIHAPSWLFPINNPGQGIAAALNTIAQIPLFDVGQAGLIMGTFNVPPNDDVTVNGSNGANVFGGLAGANGKYTQLVNNQKNMLTDSPRVAMAMEDALDLTADNFFFRKDGPTNSVTAANASLANILSAALPSITMTDDNYNYVPAPLGPALTAVEMSANRIATGVADTAATEDGSYATLEDAFAVYHDYVSNYLPLAVTINF